MFYQHYSEHKEDNLNPASILRYSLKQEIWQQIKEPESKKVGFKFSYLINYGSSILDKNLIIYGGQKISSTDLLKLNKNIFSITLDEKFTMKLVSKLSVKLVRPIAATGEKHGIIIGGKMRKVEILTKRVFTLLSKMIN